jgi:TetR/AcrR family transcriptional regulator, transcriptional repressor for nem operon
MMDDILLRYPLHMGHSRDEKTRSHERIVEAAAGLMMEGGTETPSVAEIMSAAGLTHGGFYKHFDSRDELVAEAAAAAMEASNEATLEVVAGAEDPLGAFVDWYASPAHRDNLRQGCGVARLGADASSGDEQLREVYSAQVERYGELFEQLLGADGEPADRKAALAAMSTLVGALYVSRAVGEGALSEEILESARAAVKAAGEPR